MMTAALRRTSALAAALALCLTSFVVTSGVTGSVAGAAPCSTSTGASSCSVGTQTTVTAGTLSVAHSPSLFWSFVGTGYDQWASGSATALSSCTTGTGSVGTSCAGGTKPVLLVNDATGSMNGWALSAYVTSNNLPAGSVLTFNGAGASNVSATRLAPIGANPYVGTTPGAVCDYGSSCTAPTSATTCSHSAQGFTTCPSYGVNLLAGTGPTAQVDLYSANAGTGAGALCFGSGTPTAAGCTGLNPNAFYNLGVRGNASAGTYTGAVINLSVTSGP